MFLRNADGFRSTLAQVENTSHAVHLVRLDINRWHFIWAATRLESRSMEKYIRIKCTLNFDSENSNLNIGLLNFRGQSFGRMNTKLKKVMPWFFAISVNELKINLIK